MMNRIAPSRFSFADGQFMWRTLFIHLEGLCWNPRCQKILDLLLFFDFLNVVHRKLEFGYPITESLLLILSVTT